MEKLFIWVVLTLVPLIPTFITHKFLESNSAYKNASQGIKLSGAIAAYFILLFSAFLTYGQLNSDPLMQLRTDLAGKWACNGTVSVSGDNETSSKSVSTLMEIHVNNNSRISLTGEIPSEHGPMYWQAEEVIVTDKKLIYIFDMPVRNATGITWLSFSYSDDRINALFGSWVVTGGDGRGSVSCFRDEPEMERVLNWFERLGKTINNII